jgi:hypothetical protein
MDLSNPTPRWEALRNEEPGTHEFLSGLARAEFEAGETGVDPSAIDAEGARSAFSNRLRFGSDWKSRSHFWKKVR